MSHVIVGRWGKSLVSHPRSIDIAARPVRYAGSTVSPETAQLVRAKLDAFVTIRV
ncbi:MAG TPA: hypothetical protein VMB84_18440 [Stellaceae bacterium]|nr:hypothetical protein [Stellaceae bacterium]